MAVISVAGYKVFPLKFSTDSSAKHDLFIKEHSVRKPTVDKPSGRTLFIVNMPPYATVASVKNLFNSAGKVSNVIFSEAPTEDSNSAEKKASQNVDQIFDRSKFFSTKEPIAGFKIAYVVFEKPIGLIKALELTSLPPLSTKEKPILSGYEKWIKEYNSHVVNPVELQADIDKFMKKFDKTKEKQALIDKKQGQTDDEGWVTVTRQGRRPGLARTEAINNKIKNKKRKNLVNFYTFQIRESKKQHLAELRQKFEEDKKKITLLKQSRRFKPF